MAIRTGIIPSRTLSRRAFLGTAASVAAAVALPGRAAATTSTASLLLLHTNDLHDHLRPDYDGVGGMPYISGYVRQASAGRDDVLLLDAGDVMEKGDLVAFRSKSMVMYEAMQRIGFHASAIGNHDIAYGVPHFHAVRAHAPGVEFPCVNLFKADGSLEVPASAIFTKGRVRVGVIGATRVDMENSLSLEATGHAIALEAERLKYETDLLIALCHIGSKYCHALSLLAPTVDLFIGGHNHDQALPEGVRVEETGAYIVQSDYYARQIGHVELEVDLDTRRIVKATSKLVELRHDTVPADEEMIDWIREQEQMLCREAVRVVGHAREQVDNYTTLGRLGAEAMLAHSGADLAFCHPSRVIRGKLHKGPVDVNALFRTGGAYGAFVYKFELTGNQVHDYLNALDKGAAGETFVAGAIITRVAQEDSHANWTSDLDPERVYTVVMPFVEFEKRFLNAIGLQPDDYPYEICDFSFTDAVAEYVEGLTARGIDLADYASQ